MIKKGYFSIYLSLINKKFNSEYKGILGLFQDMYDCNANAMPNGLIN